jgi:HJR/Mrr/RecB family endonuclease
VWSTGLVDPYKNKLAIKSAVNSKRHTSDFVKSLFAATGVFSRLEAPLYVESGHEEKLSSSVIDRPHVPVIVLGGAGTGKTTLVDYVLRSYLPLHRPDRIGNTIISRFDVRGFRIDDVQLSLLRRLQDDIRGSCAEQGIEIDRHVNGTAPRVNSVREWCDRALSVMPREPLKLDLILALDSIDQLPTDAANQFVHFGLHLNRNDAVRKVIMAMRPTAYQGFRNVLQPAQDIDILNITGLEPVIELYSGLDLPPPLVEVVQTINAELIRELQKKPELVYDLAPRRFEELIGEIFASFGWDVQLTPETKDGGYDIFAISKDVSGMRTSWIIECKRFRSDRKVGVDIARSLYAVKGDLRVANAMIATTSSFTQGVHDYKTSRYDFHLSDYEQLIEWMNQYRPNPNGQLYLKDNKLILPKTF